MAWPNLSVGVDYGPVTPCRARSRSGASLRDGERGRGLSENDNAPARGPQRRGILAWCLRGACGRAGTPSSASVGRVVRSNPTFTEDGDTAPMSDLKLFRVAADE